MSLELYKEARKTWLEKRGYFELELAKTSNASQKFELEKQIEECKVRIENLDEIIKKESILDKLPGTPSLNDVSMTSNTDMPTTPVIRTGRTVDNLSRHPEGQNIAHLIVAVFWSASGQKILVQVERCYTDPELQEIVREPVLEKEEDYELNLAQFPERLKTWVQTTTNKLESIYHNFEPPWQLIIDLLVPIDLLSGSLVRWCGETSKLPQRYPIIVRCSDRFDDRLEDKAYFYNQLKAGRERFKHQLPEIHSKMTDLDWLCPNCKCNEDLEDYSALKCLGEWLKPGQEYLENWAKLIESGIPLALWMCEHQSDCDAVTRTFNWLADSTRADFLRRIRKERRNPHEVSVDNPGYHLGVFYEHDHSIFEPTAPPFFTNPQKESA